MSDTPPAATLRSPSPEVSATDERLKETSLAIRVMRRPELGAPAGLFLVIFFFLSTADPSMFTPAGVMNILVPGAQLGILAIAAALLMIGGEFDLSIGSMVAFTGLIFGSLITIAGLALPLALVLTIVVAGLLGGINGQIVIRTRLPSFIVTLAFLFILRGLSLVAFAAVATWLLLRTRTGNWIFASGGDPNAARNSGVPVDAVKTGLFMLTAIAAALVAVITVLDAGSTDARRGVQKEFEAIIAAVIRGCLLTGGFGPAR